MLVRQYAIRNTGHRTVGCASLVVVARNLGSGSASGEGARRGSGARDPRRGRGGRVVLTAAAAAVEDLGGDDGGGLAETCQLESLKGSFRVFLATEFGVANEQHLE